LDGVVVVVVDVVGVVVVVVDVVVVVVVVFGLATFSTSASPVAGRSSAPASAAVNTLFKIFISFSFRCSLTPSIGATSFIELFPFEQTNIKASPVATDEFVELNPIFTVA